MRDQNTESKEKLKVSLEVDSGLNAVHNLQAINSIVETSTTAQDSPHSGSRCTY